MPHYGMFGRTETGKSTLAFILANRIRDSIGKKSAGNINRIVVVNPHLNKWPQADYQYEFAGEAQEYLRKNTGCVVFVEETGLLIEDYADLVRKWTTTYRHLSHSFYFIGQRFVQLPPTMRDQLKAYFVFACSDDDAMEIADQFGKPELRKANMLPDGSFYYVTYKGVWRGDIDFKNRSFKMVKV
jgi:hypothetical protein